MVLQGFLKGVEETMAHNEQALENIVVVGESVRPSFELDKAGLAEIRLTSESARVIVKELQRFGYQVVKIRRTK